jgi:hypothetical protein
MKHQLQFVRHLPVDTRAGTFFGQNRTVEVRLFARIMQSDRFAFLPLTR